MREFAERSIAWAKDHPFVFAVLVAVPLGVTGLLGWLGLQHFVLDDDEDQVEHDPDAEVPVEA